MVFLFQGDYMIKKLATQRTSVFRALTIGAAGMGGAMLGLWALVGGVGLDMNVSQFATVGAMVCGLAALAAAGAAHAYFVGVDESGKAVTEAAMVDETTGLRSRLGLIHEINRQQMNARGQAGERDVLIDIEIDRFKELNDALGYLTGDRLLINFATRLLKMSESVGTACRVSGGEFSLLMRVSEDPHELKAVMEALLAALSKPYFINKQTLAVTCSAGVAELPATRVDAFDALRKANLARHHARASGRGTWSLYHEEMSRAAEYRRWIEAELQGALDHGDFVIYYQPQVSLTENHVVGYEALVRWMHPEKGMIPPGEFISVAEESGLIGPLGDWIVERVCLDAHMMPADTTVAVNLSPIQFLIKDMVAFLRDTLRKTQLDPSRLEVEITENIFMEDREQMREVFSELGKMGISVAVDDFGTGYSNLTYLSEFPFQKLKIDQSFVRRLEHDRNTGAIVSTIIGLSRALDVKVVAEGVETEAQALLLKAAGCDVVQGYLYGRPAPIGRAVRPALSVAH